MIRRAARLAALAALLAPVAALGHEVLHDVARGRAVAVRAYFADGEPLAYAPYEIWSPADAAIPYQQGRSDRGGWIAFVPDAPGRWRVRVMDDTGHGLDLQVDATAPAPSAAPSTAALMLRPLVGLVAIAAAFAGLVAFHRRKGRA